MSKELTVLESIDLDAAYKTYCQAHNFDIQHPASAIHFMTYSGMQLGYVINNIVPIDVANRIKSWGGPNGVALVKAHRANHRHLRKYSKYIIWQLLWKTRWVKRFWDWTMSWVEAFWVTILP